MPRLWEGPRRVWLALLVGLGLGQAGLGMAMAWAMLQLQDAAHAAGIRWAILTMVLVAFSVGALRVHERVVAEKLGQHYVREVRRELIRSALTPGDSSSLGVTVARTTNDLTSVRNWIAQGVAPMVVAAPLLVGVLTAFAVLDWRITIAALVPLAVLVAGFVLWAGDAYAKSRALRKTRGAMASRIAETVTASEAIIAAGGAHRELRNIDEVSGRIVERAVARAETLGLLRATGVVAATLMTLVVAATGTLVELKAGVIVAAMAIAGIAAAPLMDMGRVVEFRQSFLAARAVLEPTLANARERRAQARDHRSRAAELIVRDVEAPVYLHLPGAVSTPVLADYGQRFILDGERNAVDEVIARIAGTALPYEDRTDYIRVGERNLSELPARDRRRHVGVARGGASFERGSLWRAARYRRPDLRAHRAHEVLDAVGLTAESLPDGHGTMLRRGGGALSVDQRARLSLARALHGDPMLVVVDRLEGDLEADGIRVMIDLLRKHHGVVLLAGCPATADALNAVPLPVMSGSHAVRATEPLYA